VKLPGRPVPLAIARPAITTLRPQPADTGHHAHRDHMAGMTLTQIQLIRLARQLELHRRRRQPPGCRAAVLGTAPAARRVLHRHGTRIFRLRLAFTLRTQPRRAHPNRLPAARIRRHRNGRITLHQKPRRRDHHALDDPGLNPPRPRPVPCQHLADALSQPRHGVLMQAPRLGHGLVLGLGHMPGRPVRHPGLNRRHTPASEPAGRLTRRRRPARAPLRHPHTGAARLALRRVTTVFAADLVPVPA
jgi:hypothetical protein